MVLQFPCNVTLLYATNKNYKFGNYDFCLSRGRGVVCTKGAMRIQQSNCIDRLYGLCLPKHCPLGDFEEEKADHNQMYSCLLY